MNLGLRVRGGYVAPRTLVSAACMRTRQAALFRWHAVKDLWVRGGVEC